MSARSAAVILALAAATIVSPATALLAQVINGQSTDDAAYAPRPPARWHSPEFEKREPGGERQDDGLDGGARSELPRR